MDTPFVAVDTETPLIEQGLLAPPLVCATYQFGHEPNPSILHQADPQTPRWLSYVFGEAAAGRLIIVGHNFAFDAAVLLSRYPELAPLIFGAYDAGMIHDTLLQAKLLDLSVGDLSYRDDEDTGKRVRIGYSLDAVWQRLGGAPLDKGGDSWRLRYGELIDVALEHWPARALEYALFDATATLRVYQSQRAEGEKLSYTMPGVLNDSGPQARQAFGLHLESCRGFMIDGPSVDVVEEGLTVRREKAFAALLAAGWVGKNGTSISQAPVAEVVEDHGAAKVTNTHLWDLYNSETVEFPAVYDPMPGVEIWPPNRERDVWAAKKLGIIETTPTGKVKASADLLNQIPDERLRAKVEHSKTLKGLSTYVNKMHWATKYPVQSRVNSLLETGRTSMSGWTGFPREMKTFSPQTFPRVGGFRECVRPREGYVFADVDYAVAELRSLGEVMFQLFGLGGSPLARGFQEDIDMDPHTELAALMMGISADKAHALKAAGKLKRRKDAKAGNFGFPGGMGIARFMATEAKRYWDTDGTQGGLYTEDQAKEIKKYTVARWGWKPYFDLIAEMSRSGGTIRQLVSGRYRGGVGFCDGANGYFQALTADYAKEAAYRVAKSCHLGLLRGCFPVLFIHDQLLVEVPIEGAGEYAEEVARIMVTTANEYTPNVPAVAEPALCDRFSKDVETLRAPDGTLQIWSPA